MPCKPCGNGKWKFGKGPCKYKSKKACREVEKAYYATGGFKRKTKKKR